MHCRTHTHTNTHTHTHIHTHTHTHAHKHVTDKCLLLNAPLCSGYGSRAPGNCWLTVTLVATHSLLAVVLNSVILGIAFARISHPKNRGRTVLISDCAVIARRNGTLKL